MTYKVTHKGTGFPKNIRKANSVDRSDGSSRTSRTAGSSPSWHSSSRISDWKQRSVSRETREYDLRRDSFEQRIEKQRRRTSWMTVQNRSRGEDEETMTRWKAGLMKNSVHSWQTSCWSKNHWIDLSLNRSNHRGRVHLQPVAETWLT